MIDDQKQDDLAQDNPAQDGSAQDSAEFAAEFETNGAGAEGGDDSPVLERRDQGEANRRRRAIFGVPVEVVVSVGRANPLIGDLLTMRRDALLPLDARIDDPVEVYVGKRVIARGELQEIGENTGRLGVRLTEIVDMSDMSDML